MSRRNRKRRRPQAQRPKAEAPPARGGKVSMVGPAGSREVVQVEPAAQENPTVASLREDFGLVVRETATYDADRADEVDEVLVALLGALRAGHMNDELRGEFNMRLIAAGVEVGQEDVDDLDEESEEEAAERIEDELAETRDRQADERPPISDEFEDVEELPPPTVELPELERGPLAGGILMMEAMLTEAKAGYIAAQITVLEEAINEEFEPHERALMADAASQWRDPSGLPDVPGAYQALVVYRATEASRAQG